MGHISKHSPELHDVIKALSGGTMALLRVLLFNDPFSGGELIVATLTVGFLSFGVGLVLLISALRAMDAEQAIVKYATAPFIGWGASLILFVDPLTDQFRVAFPFFYHRRCDNREGTMEKKRETGGKIISIGL